MKTIQLLVVAAAFMLSIGTGIAGTDGSVTATDGFHAFSQVTNAEAQTLTALTDEQLGNVVGGYLAPDQNPSDFPPWILPYVRTAKSYTFGGSSGGPWYPNPEDPDRPWGPIGPVVKQGGILAIDTVPQPGRVGNWNLGGVRLGTFSAASIF